MSTPETPVIALETSRRSFLKTCAAGAGMVSASAIGTLIPAGVKSAAYAGGSDAQDGLVANAAKYVGGQPIIAVNPDAEHFDGILIPFLPSSFFLS